MKKYIAQIITPIQDFLLLWIGQSISQLGSSMTSFALIIWAYQKQGTVMSIALLSVCSYMPYVVVSLFAGALIDRYNKKKIMLICDTVAAICTIGALTLLFTGNLQIGHLYVINAISGFMNAFQGPASKVAITLIVSEDQYTRVSGLRSLSDSMISVFTPILATAVVSIFGIGMVFTVDLLTYAISFISLLLWVKIPHTVVSHSKKTNFIEESWQGVLYLKENKGFLYLMLFMAGINLMAAMAFYSVLPAMILARSDNNAKILGLVSSAMGIGGIVGGFLVSIVKPTKNNVKTIFVSAALSFLLCDVLLGVGKNPYIWILAAFAGNIPIPFLSAAENALLHSKIPLYIQGRIFSIRGSLQFITIPIGYLAGGFLADQVFEPLMGSSHRIQQFLAIIVGSGTGSGMAVIFIGTGILGFTVSVLSYHNKHIQGL